MKELGVTILVGPHLPATSFGPVRNPAVESFVCRNQQLKTLPLLGLLRWFFSAAHGSFML